MTRVYSAPVNYEGSDGRWHPIDNSLVGGLGGYENAANGFSLRIPEALSAGVSLSDEGHSLAFTLVGALTAPAAVSGSTASYGEVLPSTNLSYVSQSSGVEEFATLKDTGAPSELTYRLSGSTGLQPREQPDGSIALVDERGATWFTIPAPVAFARAAGAGAGRALPMSISASGSGWLLSVDTGEAWVREALAGGPVVVDPTVKIHGTASCELVAEAPKTPYCEQSTMQVGYDATHQEHHSLVEFVLASIPSESVILDAKLGAGNIPNDLYHYGERYYDPTTGKWTQPDPMGEGYEFVDDNPINATDRFGECLTILSENVCELAEIAVNSVKRTLAVGTLTPTTGESKKCIKGALVAVGIDASGRLVLSEPFKRFAGTYALGVGCLVGVMGA